MRWQRRKIIGNCVLELKEQNKTIISANGNEIEIDAPYGLRSAEIYSLEGRLLMSMQGEKDRSKYHIMTGDLPKGFYIISVTDATGNSTVKKIIR